MGWVISVLTGLTVLTGVLMTFLILLQEGKGGGLAALGGTKAAGVEGVTNPVRRATAYLAVVFFIMLVTLGIMHKPETSLMKGQFNTASAGAGAAKPAEAPAVVTPVAPVAPAAATSTEAPKAVELPKISAPATTEPKPAETLKTETPKVEAPKVEAPKTDAPKAEAPKTDAPKAEEAKK